VAGRVKPSFVIFDIRALWRSALSFRVPGCQKLPLNPFWHRMLYSCTHMTTVGVEGFLRNKLMLTDTKSSGYDIQSRVYDAHMFGD